MTTVNSFLVDAIAASGTNPRKHFDKAALQSATGTKELGITAQRHGIDQAAIRKRLAAEAAQKPAKAAKKGKAAPAAAEAKA